MTSIPQQQGPLIVTVSPFPQERLLFLQSYVSVFQFTKWGGNLIRMKLLELWDFLHCPLNLLFFSQIWTISLFASALRSLVGPFQTFREKQGDDSYQDHQAAHEDVRQDSVVSACSAQDIWRHLNTGILQLLSGITAGTHWLKRSTPPPKNSTPAMI